MYKLFKNLFYIENHYGRYLLDLQYRTIIDHFRQLAPLLPGTKKGNKSPPSSPCFVLDFGSGKSNYAQYFPYAHYQSYDPYLSAGHDFASFHDLNNYLQNNQRDAQHYPLFDIILLIEVLEHVENISIVLQMIFALLQKDGSVLVTIPFAAREHPAPHDFRRFTQEGLEQLLRDLPFRSYTIYPRGNNLCTISSKLNYYTLRCLRSIYCWWGIILLPISLFFLLMAHLSLSFKNCLQDDPLGFTILLKK